MLGEVVAFSFRQMSAAAFLPEGISAVQHASDRRSSNLSFSQS
jgi:hypothetical protein